MKKHNISAILTIILLVVCALPTFAQRRAPQNRQFYDSIFNAYHKRSLLGSNDTLTADIKRMLRMAKRDGNKNAQMLALMDLAINEGQRGNLDTMFDYMEKVHQMDDRNTPYSTKAYEFYSDGIVYYIAHQYTRSIDALEKANQAFKSLNDSTMRAKTLVNISSIYSDQMMYYKAENVLNEAIEYTNNDTRPITLLHLAGLKMKMGAPKEGSSLLNESLKLMKSKGFNPHNIDPFTSNYWRYYHHLRYYYFRLQNNLDSAHYHIDQMMDVLSRYGRPEDKCAANLLYAELFQSQNEYQKAIDICRIILADTNLNKDDIKLGAYKILAPCLAKTGNYKEAYEAELAVNQISESSSLANTHDLASAEMFSHYEMRIRRMENAQHERLVRSTAITSTAIVAALVSLFTLLILRITKRNENKSNSADDTAATPANDATMEWINFEQKFNSQNSDFVNRLNALYPNLTGTEMKICMLIREGIDDDQSAKILNLSINSMKVYRSRIRKKFQLTTSNTSVDDFLMQI